MKDKKPNKVVKFLIAVFVYLVLVIDRAILVPFQGVTSYNMEQLIIRDHAKKNVVKRVVTAVCIAVIVLLLMWIL